MMSLHLCGIKHQNVFHTNNGQGMYMYSTGKEKASKTQSKITNIMLVKEHQKAYSVAKPQWSP